MNHIEKNKQNKGKCLVIESTNISHNDFQSILNEHVWLEELCFRHVNLSKIDEKKVQLNGNLLNQLTQLQMSSCQLNHVPLYICELATGASNLKQSGELSTLRRNSVKPQSVNVGIHAMCWQHSLITLDLSNNLISEIPSSITLLVSLQTLILNMNQFTKFPKVLKKMNSLTALYMKGNKLTKLEENLFYTNSLKSLFGSNKKKAALCRTLKKLNLGHNSLQEFPDALAGFSVLQELDLSHNVGIKGIIEKDISNYAWKPTLQMLNLDNCGLQQFPTLICKLPNLRYVHVSRNAFKVIPKLGNLPYLSTLAITSCEIEDISPIFPQKMLRKLNVSQNNIKNIPELSIHSSNFLEELLLSNNCLTKLGPELKAYSALVSLDCGHNNISEVDPSISSLINLKYLNLSHNNITSLADDILVGLKNLRQLNLSHNKRLEKVPTLTHCKNLQRFYCRCNSIAQFPSVEGLRSLIELDLSNNLLIDIHWSLYECELLEILDISCNLISSLEPKNDTGSTNIKDISNLFSIRKLKIDRNDILELPDSIVELENLDCLRISFQKPLTPRQTEWISKYSIKVFNTIKLPYQIQENLLIGTRDSVSNLSVIQKELGITHILNLCSRNIALRLDRFETLSRYEAISTGDDPNKIGEMFNNCCDFIDKGVKGQNCKCLIICDDCLFYSPLIALSYEVKTSHATVDIPQLIRKFQDKLPMLKLPETNKTKIEKLLRIYDEYIHPVLTSAPVAAIPSAPIGANLLAGLLSKNVPLIKALLTNDRNRAYFKQFCEEEKSIENISFWEEVELRYKKIQDGLQRYAFARKIFETFIDPYDAPYQLNIEQRLVDEIESQLDAFSYLDSYLAPEDDENSDDKDLSRMSLAFPLHTFFDNLVIAAERLMIDTAQRFQKSKLYQLMETDALSKNADVKFLIQTPPSSFRSLTGL